MPWNSTAGRRSVADLLDVIDEDDEHDIDLLVDLVGLGARAGARR